MPMIEGLGDEVTLILAGFLFFVVVMLAWLSTQTTEIPLLRGMGVIVVELAQRTNHATPPAESSVDDSSVNATANENTSEPVAASSESGDGNTAVAQELPPSQQSQSPEVLTPEVTTDDASSQQAKPLPEASHSLAAGAESDSSSGSQKTDSENKSTSQKNLSSLPEGSNLETEESKPTEEEMRKKRVRYFQSLDSDVPGEGCPASQTNPVVGDVQNNSAVTSNSSNSPDEISEHVTSSPETELRHRLKPTTEGAAVNSSPVTELKDNSDSTSIPASDSASTPAESAAAASGSTIRVKLKYMNETQRLVYAKPLDTIGDFRRANFQTELADDKWVRFIFNGRHLRDDRRTLQACSIGDNCTMHCLITARSQTPRTEATEEEENDDSMLANLMYPIFAVVLLIVWYFRFMYRQYFSALSTVCLLGISFLLALSYISTLRWPDTPPTSPNATPQQTPRAAGTSQTHQHSD